jgi:8-oxo-dGTP pyrophosphatase MutT (NUDIX family)
MNDNYCNNCGKQGHLYHQCKMPITSIGIIVFRYNHTQNNNIEYLMIRRKDTLGFIDFMRGKYSIYNKEYLINMFKQMTYIEKEKIRTMSFDELWKDIWKIDNISNQYKIEEVISKDKFNSLKNGILNRNIFYSIETIIEETSDEIWDEPEWGFPKGRRNYMEKDYECAIREFNEETGFNINKIKNVQNVLPFEEIFTGSNYKSYKHKYFLSFIQYDETIPMDKFEKSEVSKMEWNTYEDCLNKIRPYNLEKKRLITNVNNTLTNFRLLGY